MATKGRIETMTKKATKDEQEFADSGIEVEKQIPPAPPLQSGEKVITGEDVLKTLRDKGMKI